MIFVNRNEISPPSILSSERVSFHEKKMRSFFLEHSKSMKKQSSYHFRRELYQNEEIRNILNELFNQKCAYCESIVEYGATEHFRPKSRAMNLDGKVSDDHYWWLAYKWENLYPSCKFCNRNKQTRFPVQAKRIQYNQQVSQEKAILLDPCNKEDFKEVHIQVNPNGEFNGISQRGKVTIEVLNLNREFLIGSRKGIIDQISTLLKRFKNSSIEDPSFNEDYEEIHAMLQYKAIHCGVSIAVLHGYLESQGLRKKEKDSIAALRKLQNQFEVGALSMSMGSSSRSEKASKLSQNKVSYNINLDSAEAKTEYFTSAKKIRRIEIENFKIIKSLKLDFPKPEDNDEPWMILLGENGSGKSTVLQAITLTLIGENKANQLGINAANFVNRNSRKSSGQVRVFLEGMDIPVELNFSKKSNLFSSNYKEPLVILMAFGSTRMMAQKDLKIQTTDIIHVLNLFDPYTALPNVESWIGNPRKVNTELFDKIAIELKKMLQLPADQLIYRRKVKEGENELFIKIKPEKQGIRLKDLSAGYQAVLILTITIIRDLLKVWDDFTIAEGIVLIDEIGVHLHPRWKMQIVRTLREIFPAVTFIVTTHEPLCLRGVNEGEVILMKFDEEQEVIGISDLPSPKHLTVEQLMTSKFFGLITSFDPEIEVKLNTYYSLKSKSSLTGKETLLLTELTTELQEMNAIGGITRIDKMQEAIDIVLTDELYKQKPSEPVKNVDLKNRIKKIWNS